MNRKMAAVILLLMMFAVSIFIDSQIKRFNLNFYHGKDDGAFVQLESILVFTILFYSLISRQNRFVFAFIGLFIGIIISFAAYCIFGTDILFPMTSSVLVVIIFYLLEKRISNMGRNNKES